MFSLNKSEIEKVALSPSKQLGSSGYKHSQFPTESLSDASFICEALELIPWIADFSKKKFTLLEPLQSEFLGYPAEAWENFEFFKNQVLSDDRPTVMASFDRAIKRQTDFNIQFRIRDRSLRIRYYKCFGQVFIPKDSGAPQLRGYLMDVTEKETAKLLLEGRRQILEMLAMGRPLKEILDILLLQIESQCDGMLCSVLRLEQPSRKLRVLSGPHMPIKFNKAIDGVMIGPSVGSCGTAAYHKTLVITEDIATDERWDGYRDEAISQGLRACWSMPLFSSTGEVLGTIAMYYSQPRNPNDFETWLIMESAKLASIVVENSLTRQTLTETVSILNSSIEATGEGVLVVDKNGNIISSNKKFSEIWRIPASKLALASEYWVLDLVKDQVESPDTFLKRVSEINQTVDAETFDIVELRDGRIFELHSKPHRVNSVIGGRVWSYRDVTKWRWTEMEAVAARKAKTHFLANISHEIRTPLSAVLGFSDMLVRATADHPDRSRWMDRIRKNGELLLKVVNEILDLSRADHGKIELQITDVNLCTTVSDVLATFEEKAKEKGIDLVLKIDGVVPQEIRTDRFKLQQILINVVGNALKFTQKGKIETVVKFWPPKVVRIDVIDSGPGISVDRLPALFLPFEQGDDSYSRRFGGAGLGLALSRKMARALGGDIRLISTKVNEGSTFQIEIATEPCVKPASFVRTRASKERTSPAEVSALASGPALAGVRILLVEDSDDNQLLVSEFLRQAGAAVDFASNGVEGVDKALKMSYDAILMDIQMPIKDGLQATRELRQAGYPGPILALTAHALPEERERTAAAGCNDHITKPIRREEMIVAIAKALRAH